MTPAALAGVRVVDFSSGRCGGQATTVLADFGAEVTKVEPPGGDRFRTCGSSPFWLRGKDCIELDLNQAGDRDRAAELAGAADVCVVAGPPARLRRWGLDAESLRAAAPELVHATITGFGSSGPDADLPGYEGLVAARAGRMAAFDVQLGQGRPTYAAVQVATHLAGQGAVHGILAALVQRARTGQGATVETSLLQALSCFDLVDSLAAQLAVRDGVEFTPLRLASPMPTLNYHPLRTADGGWIQCGNLLEHLFFAFLDATDLLGELLVDDRYQGGPATWSPEAIEHARDRILVRMQERTTDEWMAVFDADGNVAAEPIISTAAALGHRDIAASLVQVEDPVVGLSTQIGPIADLAKTPAQVPRLGSPRAGNRGPKSPAPGGTTPSLRGSATAPGGTTETAAPLADITILDLSTIIAGPLAISMLADLGARVIKVEPLAGDPFRQLLTEGRMAVKTNAGKESICIDLKSADGQAVLHRMAESADVVVHNFRGEVPARLGVDVDTLHAINPDLVCAVVNGYGPNSPSALRPATHPVMGAATGGVAYQAGDALTRDCADLAELREAARQIMAANEANPDPNTSVVAASAILLALVARDRHPGLGGQRVHVNMQTANAWANGDDFIDYPGKPPRPAVDPELRGLSATYRLYPTGDGWVFLATPGDREFATLCEVAGWPDLAERFATQAERAAFDHDLAVEIEARFGARSAAEWESVLVGAGVGCLRADGIDVGTYWSTDPQILANGWAPWVDHARFGRVRRWPPLSTVGGLNADYDTAPLAGEHTDALLAEFGHSPTEIASLRAANTVNSEPHPGSLAGRGYR